ncbi:MAG: SufD family Fe-S cluster assembly protein [Pseudomonadota bacterium]
MATIQLTPFEERLFADLPESAVTNALRERGLPGRRTEAWKWSDLRGAEREPRQPSSDFSAPVVDAPIALDDAFVLTLKNGRPMPPAGIEPKTILSDGVKVGTTYVVDEGLIVSFYQNGRESDGEVQAPGQELAGVAEFAPLISISVLPGFEHQVAVRRLSDGNGQHSDNLFVTVGAEGRATLIETHEVAGAPFVNSRTEIELDHKATCDRYVVQPEAPGAVIVHSSIVRLDEQVDDELARLNQTTLALGAKLARHETRLTHLGESAARLDALYRLDNDLHTDITTHVTFSGEDAETDQLVKGIGDGRSRGVFQGKFLVERGAQKTDAQMAHHALLLFKGAQINAKPELEIYADDVECAHGNTAGALDPEALFYMRQRGVPEEEARALLIDAFAGEVLQRIPDETIRAGFEEIFRRA